MILHDIPTPSTGYLHDWDRDKAGKQHLSKIHLPDLQLVDLQQGLQAAGLEQWELFETNKPDYPRTRRWALYIWKTMPDAAGLVWMSKRANEGAALMLFGDRVAPGAITVAARPVPIARYEATVLAILDRLGCGLAFS